MCKSFALSVFVIAVLCHADPSHGDIVVQYRLNTTQSWTTVTTDPEFVSISGSNVTCVGPSGQWRVFTTSPSTESLGWVFFNGPSTADLLLSPNLNALNSAFKPDPACKHWDGVIQGSAGTLKVQARINADLTGPISASEVYRLDVGGDVLANVLHNPPVGQAPTLGPIEIGDDADGGNLVGAVQATRGSIDRVRVWRVGSQGGNAAGTIQADTGVITEVVVQGNLTGHVRAPFGSILNAIVTGDIGSSGPGGTVQIVARDEIRRVTAARAWADIDVTGTTTSSGILRNLTTTVGPFVGSIDAELMDSIPLQQSGVSIAGNLDADFTIRRYLIADNVTVNGWLPAGRTIKLGQGWWDPRIMTFTGGLAGQVIFNSLNQGNQLWTGQVRIGPVGNQILLSPTPYYTMLSSQIGGGAVGLAPFQGHAEDCSPPHGSNITSAGIPNNEVILRHYGPVLWATGMPVTVEYGWAQFPNLPSSWTDITRDFTVGAYDPASPRQVRVIPVTPLDFDGPLAYRIKPVREGDNRLYCQNVSLSPSVGEYAYIIWVIP